MNNEIPDEIQDEIQNTVRKELNKKYGSMSDTEPSGVDLGRPQKKAKSTVENNNTEPFMNNKNVVGTGASRWDMYLILSVVLLQLYLLVVTFFWVLELFPGINIINLRTFTITHSIIFTLLVALTFVLFCIYLFEKTNDNTKKPFKDYKHTFVYLLANLIVFVIQLVFSARYITKYNIYTETELLHRILQNQVQYNVAYIEFCSISIFWCIANIVLFTKGVSIIYGYYIKNKF